MLRRKVLRTYKRPLSLAGWGYSMEWAIFFTVAMAAICAFAMLSCGDDTHTPEPALAPAHLTASAEARHATWTAGRTAVAPITVTHRAGEEATRQAKIEERRANPPTPKPRAVMDRNLIVDIDNVGYAADALMPYLQRCIQRGDLNWDNHSRFFDDLTRKMDSIARDVRDGYLDDYSVAEVRGMISSAMNRFDQLERQCLR